MLFHTFAVVTAAITGIEALTNNNEPLLDKNFDNQVKELLDLFHVPALSIAIIHGEDFESKGYGYSRIPSQPATPDTLYYTGSTTKAFVATIAAMMVGEDKTNFRHIKWTTPMIELLEGDFALAEGYETLHTTLEDALSHRSGLPRHDPSYGWNNATTLDNVRRMRYLPLTAEPRTTWQYCNTMFGAVGAMIERQTGLDLEEVLRKWIWKPLGMNSTSFTDIDSDRVARGYFWNEEKSHYVPERYTDLSSIAGAGATVSSVNDYALWMKALLDASQNNVRGGSPITNHIWKAITGSRAIVNPDDLEPLTYGLGWIVGRLGKYTVVTHGGGLNGFGTNLFLIPELKFGFVSMGNTMGTAAQVGGVLFESLLRRLDPESASFIDESSISELHELVTQRSAFEGLSDIDPTGSHRSLPLPGNAEDYVGMYAHPAYGIYNVSVISSKDDLGISAQHPLFSESQIRFRVEPSTRLWRTAMTLKHSSHLLFDMDISFVAGPIEEDQVSKECGSVGNLVCKNEEAQDLLATTIATFDFAPDGSRVEKLGLQIEPEMIRYAGEVGGKENWREGMIWFNKV